MTLVGKLSQQHDRGCSLETCAFGAAIGDSCLEIRVSEGSVTFDCFNPLSSRQCYIASNAYLITTGACFIASGAFFIAFDAVFTASSESLIAPDYILVTE
jgi:hypothetical protein